ncbi:hypothetical protein CLOM_g12673 [Closterium sp. NIES-68]|nr:hypothetical protein CLOM_g12673 [Closterium sp. NIES-68]GJP82773.1 hypothetical protein CLOP_g13009 [Closterium sp. NIES-67]
MSDRKSHLLKSLTIFAALALLLGLMIAVIVWKQPWKQPSDSPTFVRLPNSTRGAKCLDGSPPGYYFRRGRDSGRLKWHIHLPGGGWCVTVAECAKRARTRFGSTKGYTETPPKHVSFEGMLSPNKSSNPSFHNWNLARLVYCDGGGYAGTRGRVNLSDGTLLGLNSAAPSSAVPSSVTSSKTARLAAATGPILEAIGPMESMKSMESTESLESTDQTGSNESPASAIYLDGWNIVQAVLKARLAGRPWQTSVTGWLLHSLLSPSGAS